MGFRDSDLSLGRGFVFLCLGALGEVVEFEDASRPIPHDLRM